MAKEETAKESGPTEVKSEGVPGNNRFRRNKQNQASPTVISKTIEGDTPGLKGHIYSSDGANQTDVFVKTTQKLAEYVGREWVKNYGNDMRKMVTNLTKPTIPMPTDIAQGATETQKRIWQKMTDDYVNRVLALESNNNALYDIILGQCTEGMKNKIASLPNYEDVSSELDGLNLLIGIKSIVYQYQSSKYLAQALHEAVRRSYLFRQGKTMTLAAYLEMFINITEVIGYSGGSLGNHPGLVEEVRKEKNITEANMTNNQKIEFAEIARERYLAVAFLLHSDQGRYKEMIRGIENSYNNGHNMYPQTLNGAYNMLLNFKPDPRDAIRGPHNDGIAFTTIDNETGEEVVLANTNTNHGGGRGRNTRKGATPVEDIICHKCKEKGHYANQCPNAASDDKKKTAEESATNLLMTAVEAGEFDNDDSATCDDEHFQFFQNNNVGTLLKTDGTKQVPDTWILLDSQSTIDVFHNKSLLTNIRNSNTKMIIHCNAGTITTSKIGDLAGYGTVWYSPSGIANILSVARVIEKGYRVQFDSSIGNNFAVIKPDGSQRIFTQSDKGLFFFDTHMDATVLISTVEGNKSKFTNRDYSRALLARSLQRIIGRPSTRTFIKYIENKLIPNCPVTKRDIAIAESIFGPDVGSLKGKTTRRQPDHVDTDTVDIPSTIMEHYRNVTIACDIMFVNKIPFLITISRNLKFATSEMIPNQKAATILKAMKNVKAIYSRRGFQISTALMDGQFETLRGDLAQMQITLNTTSNDEHVPEVERYIRTVKERARSVVNTLPFQRLPTRIIIELISYCVFWLNSFPPQDSISADLSPRAIITGSPIHYDSHCQLEFGTYVQTHEPHDNTMATRTTGAIATRPSGNAQGGHFFYSLSTGRLLNRTHWTVLPMPNDVIARMDTLARRDRANRQGLIIADRAGNPILDPHGDNDDADEDDDDDYDPNDDPDDVDNDEDDDADPDDGDDDIDSDDEEPDNDHDDDIPIAGVYGNDAHNDIPGVDDNNAIIIPDNNGNNNNDENENDDDNEDDNNDNNGDDNDNNHIIDLTDADTTTMMDNKYGKRNTYHNLRPRKQRTYDHLHVSYAQRLGSYDYPYPQSLPSTYHDSFHKPNDTNYTHGVLEAVSMTQHSMKKGIKLFGDEGVNAVLSELQQLNDRDVLEPVLFNDLTAEQKARALAYLMFLKEKRTGAIKGRGCADGRKQRLHTKKEDSSSPTVAIESLFISTVIDAKERRDVATIDLPGAFMHADMDDIVHMKLDGTMADLLVRIDPTKYQKYVRQVNGKSVLYVRLKKALYGTLKAALLFWKHLTSKLTSWGFIVNPYDWCVANKEINGTQCTILWHVDDLKISHVDPKVVDNIVQMFQDEFGKEAPCTVRRGKIHDYLGMQLDYSNADKVQISMFTYIQTMLEESPADMSGESATPCANHLFEVNDKNPTLLDKDKAELFHHLTAKLLFLCKRARPDVQTAVAFLCTRVTAPDLDDYKKLTRVMRYLRGTATMPLTLEADNLQVIKWWVDASYAVHNDMRSHTGGAFSLGKGAIYGTSTRQKLNTKSSTEAELVGVSDVMPQIIWTRNFLEAQGYSTGASTIYQDNQSAMLLENNVLEHITDVPSTHASESESSAPTSGQSAEDWTTVQSKKAKRKIARVKFSIADKPIGAPNAHS